MKKKSLTASAATVAALVALTACSNSNNDQATQSNTAASVTATTASAETHNQADVTFAQQMIPHHAQAIEMSDVVLAKDGIDPRVTDLANQIKAAQGPEIERLQGWLTEWGQSSMPMSTSGMMTPGQSMPMSTSGMMTPGQSMPMSMPGMEMPGDSGMGMSGMMSAEDMSALQNAQGVDASRLFLTQMITHHQGAIAMAQTEIDSGQYPDAVAMARTIADTQQQEITTMQNILASL
ncbi:DUF305 domain-containing protein [Rhodococcus sp. ACS1]|uniref:DUF305 domain-containing protein n=1 Tax=unclassified Rhodococcus (in: high G+C Gram-positive bacteria) TaxID=192944 RepID=UPI000BB0F7BC|nr:MULTISPECIES: DUF305 domain-containing protein [unclassified Rhodococcus (in: high G+C Gram-positive bacteria)]MDI9938960.1 DUF305 domain-containing protein [Rhodococcus sp. IEGM 1351]PBC35410.1 DUF305 domain-containing protein [Rhodococcus sp. ACS1]